MTFVAQQQASEDLSAPVFLFFKCAPSLDNSLPPLSKSIPASQTTTQHP